MQIKDGTAYITDAGMCGPEDSVLGREAGAVLKKFYLGMPVRFPVAGFPVVAQGVLLDVDKESGKALNAVRWEKHVSSLV